MMAIWLDKRRPEVGCMAASHADTGWDDSLTFRLLGNGDEACFGSFKLQFTLNIFVWSCLCLAIHRVLPQWKTHLESQINLKYVINHKWIWTVVFPLPSSTLQLRHCWTYELRENHRLGWNSKKETSVIFSRANAMRLQMVLACSSKEYKPIFQTLGYCLPRLRLLCVGEVRPD